MEIDWGKIVTNAVSVLVATLVLGAGGIVWKGATTVDDKVSSAMAATQEQYEYMQKAIELLQKELREQKAVNNQLIRAIQDLKEGKRVREPMELNVKEVPEENYIQQMLPPIKFPKGAR